MENTKKQQPELHGQELPTEEFVYNLFHAPYSEDRTGKIIIQVPYQRLSIQETSLEEEQKP